jgi:carbon monoxide dehydrogenase subunit G
VQIAPDEFVAEMAIPLGLATTRLTVYVHRHDVAAPHRCALRFEARTERTGGDGDAVLELVADTASSTLLHAGISVAIEGAIGVLGAPLIELAAHEMARQFFEGLRVMAGARHAQARMA